VLPASLRTAFAEAAGGGSTVEWRAESGGVHTLHVVGAGGTGAVVRAAAGGAPGAMATDPPCDFQPLLDVTSDPRMGAAAYAMATLAGDADEPLTEVSPGAPGADPTLVGTVVHRLFQGSHGLSALDPLILAARAKTFLAGREEDPESTRSGLVGVAVDAFLRLRRRQEVADLIDDATCYYEVPFSLCLWQTTEAGASGAKVIVRGSIDCLAQQRDGRVIVVEFKTGRHRAWHAAQIALYVLATRSMFPGSPVEGRLIYLDSQSDAAVK
jgi:hypothetical protein